MAKEAGKEKRRATILRQMKKIANGRVNDVVKLTYLTEEELDKIDKLDLSALSEFKRNRNGTVEIKLVDRMAALEKMASMEKQGDDREAAQEFFRALEGEQGEA